MSRYWFFPWVLFGFEGEKKEKGTFNISSTKYNVPRFFSRQPQELMKMHKVVLAVILASLGTTATYSATVTLSTDYLGFNHQGWWSDLEVEPGDSDNYFTGYIATSSRPNTSRGYFTFDLSSISGLVTSATIRIRLGDTKSPDSEETIGLFDVSTPASTLDATLGIVIEIFEDLGTGSSYGLKDIKVGSPPDTILQIPLNQIAIAELNANIGGSFSVGASLITLGQTAVDEYAFGYSQGFANQLVLDIIPEPSTTALLFVGPGLAVARRRAGHTCAFW